MKALIVELDDEMARSVCVIGSDTRDELWGSPEKTGEEIIPVGQTVFINGVPFTVMPTSGTFWMNEPSAVPDASPIFLN